MSKPTGGRPGRKLGYEAPATLRATRTPEMKDLHWAAGLIEGEGSFASPNGSQVVQVEMTDAEPPRRLLELFGGSFGIRKRKPPRLPLYGWTVSGSRARGVMLTLYSLLCPRRQAQIRFTFSHSEA